MEINVINTLKTKKNYLDIFSYSAKKIFMIFHFLLPHWGSYVFVKKIRDISVRVLKIIRVSEGKQRIGRGNRRSKTKCILNSGNDL